MAHASCMIYTLNEEANLPVCLASLGWCDDVVVIDSFSTDQTEAIATEYGARFVQHAFTGFGDQRNWSLEHVPTRHAWILILDADERVPDSLAEEIDRRLAHVAEDVGAFRLRRRFHLWGRWLRYSSLYPTWVVRLVHRDKVRYVNRGHAETQEVAGRIDSLEHDLIDENQKGLFDWFARQNRYSSQEASYELSLRTPPIRNLFSRDPLRRREVLKGMARRLPGRPFWYFLYAYLLRGGFLDGADGLRFCAMKAMYQSMIALKKHERRRRGRPADPDAADTSPGAATHAAPSARAES